MRSETKIFNLLDSGEFGSNPPLKKKNLVGVVISQAKNCENRSLKNGGKCLLTFWQELEVKKKSEFENLELFNKV